jgi:hypothetical protein
MSFGEKKEFADISGEARTMLIVMTPDRQQKRPMRDILTASISIMMLMLPIVSARSDEFPVLNVLPLCRGIIDQGADPLQTGDPSVSLKQCLDAEQEDRETMKKEWPTFSADEKRHCVAEARVGGESSYTDLITCLEMARDVQELRKASAIAVSAKSSPK